MGSRGTLARGNHLRSPKVSSIKLISPSWWLQITVHAETGDQQKQTVNKVSVLQQNQNWFKPTWVYLIIDPTVIRGSDGLISGYNFSQKTAQQALNPLCFVQSNQCIQGHGNIGRPLFEVGGEQNSLKSEDKKHLLLFHSQPVALGLMRKSLLAAHATTAHATSQHSYKDQWEKLWQYKKNNTRENVTCWPRGYMSGRLCWASEQGLWTSPAPLVCARSLRKYNEATITQTHPGAT